MNKIQIEELNNKGWIELENINSDNELIRLANNLGKIVPHPNGKIIDVLIPKTKEVAIRNTFSHRFGLNSFPLHTDTAFWNIPAKYVILNSPIENNCDTTIINIKYLIEELSFDELKYLERAIYLVKTNNKTFYTQILLKINNEICFRYDPSSMKPFNIYAKKIDQILNSILRRIDINRIYWNNQKALIFDNWKTLHGRDSINNNLVRTIKRLYIY